MKRILLFMSVMLLPCASLFSQANMARRISPVEVNTDNTVTFSYQNPKAISVKLSGEFVKTGQPSVDMTEKDGVWSYTTEPLASEMYKYVLIVNGQRTLDMNNISIARDGSNLFNYFIVGGGKGDLYKINDVPHGSVSKVWYDSPTLGFSRRMTVYTPAGYESSKKSYPVHYLLHGGGGDEDAWEELARTAQVMDNLIAQGKAVPMIVVMTNGNANQQAAPGQTVAATTGTNRSNTENQATFEESFKDVIKYVESNYKVIKDRSGRALSGLSMGGGHTFTIGMEQMSETFSHIGIYSSGMFGRGPADEGKFILSDHISHILNNPQKYNSIYKVLFMSCGEQDPRLPFNKKVCEEMRAKGLNIKFSSYDGGHEWKVWRDSLVDYAQMLFK